MTKQDPDKLCSICQQFDYALNHAGMISADVFVTCDHFDEDPVMVMREYLLDAEKSK